MIIVGLMMKQIYLKVQELLRLVPLLCEVYLHCWFVIFVDYVHHCLSMDSKNLGKKIDRSRCCFINSPNFSNILFCTILRH